MILLFFLMICLCLSRLKAHFEVNPRDLGNDFYWLDVCILISMFPVCMPKFQESNSYFVQIYWNMTKFSARSPLLLIYVMCLTTYWTQQLKKPANLLSLLGLQWEIPTLLAAHLRKNSKKIKTLSRHSLPRYSCFFYFIMMLGFANFHACELWYWPCF